MNHRATRPPLFDRLRTGLEDGIRFAQGKHPLRTALVPAEPPPFDAVGVRRLRERLHMSPERFAQLLNVSARVVQSWERGTRQPSQAALRLLQVLDARPELVCDICGVGPAIGEKPAPQSRQK